MFGGKVKRELTIWGRKAQMGDSRWLIGEDGLRLMLNFCIDKVEMFTRNYLNF